MKYRVSVVVYNKEESFSFDDLGIAKSMYNLLALIQGSQVYLESMREVDDGLEIMAISAV